MTTPTPRADAARPVLHFTGRFDMEVSLLAWRSVVWHSAQNFAQFMDALDRHASLMRTLRTGAAP